MKLEKKLEEGYFIYACQIIFHEPGKFGFVARVVPKGDHYLQFNLGLCTWSF
jgi:starch phosphorylase